MGNNTKNKILEINLIGAQNLTKSTNICCMHTYAIIFINPSTKLHIKLDVIGNVNPTWRNYKNDGERLVENDATSFNLSDFHDSPSPPKTVTGHMNEEKVLAEGGVDEREMKNHRQQVDDDVSSFSVGDFDSLSRKSVSTAPKSVMNDDKFSSEKGDDGEDGVYHDESDDIGYKSSSTGTLFY